ncbi:polysaccharide biosynthesis/export family protein [bacterium]|nr:polysaccharide biosynthesis/export family protein [bacterium]MBU1074179.1 polysaccharide biosynthesis/export family protein [bacterium]MBU1676965.1 polysaccharide biosynthesis/export family protein [bacterium]
MSRSLCIATFMLALAMFAMTAAAQPGESLAEYRLGAGDVVQLNVLQQPSLDRSLLIRPDGTAVIPLVGEVEMAGLTVSGAEELVRQKLRLFNHDIVDISLTVTQYNALRIYVLGAVVAPGSFTFDSSPTLWDVLREAGGADPGANLAAVRVISITGNTTTTQTYDLTGLITGTGGAPQIFLRAGDTVIVPGEEGLAAAPDTGVQVFGGVASPGTYSLTEPTRLMTVLMLAGSPLEAAALDRIWWVHDTGGGRYSSRLIDISRFIEKGDMSGNPLIHPGDTIEVKRSVPGFFRTVYPLILGSISTAAAIIFTIDRVSNR